MANRTEEAYLDMITVEDQLVHAHYEQMKRTTVEKKSKSRGKYLRPACLRNLVGNCPSCSLDLCQAAEDDHCTLPLCCCISCVVPSRCCRPGYAKLESSSEPDKNLNDVVTRISCLKTEKPEKSHQASDVLHTINRMETTNVEQSDFYAISLNFAFPNRGRLKECLAIVCPSESVSKSLKFVMLVTQKPTLLDAPAGSQVEFKAVHSKDSALLRCKARGDYKVTVLSWFIITCYYRHCTADLSCIVCIACIWCICVSPVEGLMFLVEKLYITLYVWLLLPV